MSTKAARKGFVEAFVAEAMENWQGALMGLVLLVVIMWFTSRGPSKKKKPIKARTAVDPSIYAHLKLTPEEVAKHVSKDDGWLIINDKVYVVHGYLSQHPGGDAMVKWFGKDATEAFKPVRKGGTGGNPSHPQNVGDFLPDFYIGDIVK